MNDVVPAESDRLEGAPHPRHAEHLFGQAEAERTFLEAFNGGHLHHAWLISGPRGVGKATLAWKIARFLLAQPGGGGDPTALPGGLEIDREAPVARRMAALAEPRLFLCRRPWDDKNARLKKDITVEEARKLKSFFTLSAADGGNRVALIDAVDEMNQNAANALLKILEEPPEKSTFLLVSHRPQRLLPTIRSRCRMLKCADLGPSDLGKVLDQAGMADGGNAPALGVLAGGSAGEAMRLLAQDGLALYAQLLQTVTTPPPRNRPALIALAESCTGKTGEARYDLTLRLIAVLLHRLARAGITRDPPGAEAAPNEAATLARLSPDAVAARDWAELAQVLADRSAHARAVNLDPAAVILDMMLKIDAMAGPKSAA